MNKITHPFIVIFILSYHGKLVVYVQDTKRHPIVILTRGFLLQSDVKQLLKESLNPHHGLNCLCQHCYYTDHKKYKTQVKQY